MLDTLVRLVFPLACPGCGAPAEPVCGRCARSMRPAPAAASPCGVDVWFAPFAYEGVARELVARVKYRRAHATVAWLAAAMVDAAMVDAAMVDAAVAGTALGTGAAVTWAPTTPARRRERGFDHAELLARRVARGLGLPARPLLRRASGTPQTGLAAAARRRGPTFVARRAAPGAVVVVDDVATTGATLRAAAGTLRAAGARRVVAITAARTPAPGSTR